VGGGGRQQILTDHNHTNDHKPTEHYGTYVGFAVVPMRDPLLLLLLLLSSLSPASATPGECSLSRCSVSATWPLGLLVRQKTIKKRK
jgi:hypothetical protein